MISPERQLAAMVLENALSDALRRPRGQGEGGSGINPVEIEHARAFCTSHDGAWAQSRQIWCDALGVLPELFRAYALQRMAAGPCLQRPTANHRYATGVGA